MSKQPTFVTLTKLQNREPTLLQTAIDNTCGKLNVALRSSHYEVGYRNLDAHTRFFLTPPPPSENYWPDSLSRQPVRIIQGFCIAAWRDVYL